LPSILYRIESPLQHTYVRLMEPHPDRDRKR
jgi:hypothetical protein